MKRTVDIEEITAFLSSSKFIERNDASTGCLDRITESTEDTFLSRRAIQISLAYEDDLYFKYLLDSLASVCDGSSFCQDCPINKYCNHYINSVQQQSENTALSMVDLFCGAGGLSLGFSQEGFVTKLANDIEPCCVDTYAHNHPETQRDRIILGDIKEVVKNISLFLKGQHVDIVVGGPPCQGFSEANRQRIIDDPRNTLYKSFVQVVDKIKPKFFVMENVKGMSRVKEQIIDDFIKVGYSTSACILNARDFGVPQNRERLIFIGNRIGVDNDEIFDAINKLSLEIPNFSLGDALFGLRSLEASRIKNATNVDSECSGYKIEAQRTDAVNEYIDLINQNKSTPIVCNHKARFNNDRDIEIFSRLNQGDRSDDPKIADIMPYSNRNGIFKDKYFKLEESKPCKTITAHMKFDCNMYIHPTQARGLTPREAARVQSYPDDYFFRGPYTKTYMQIGNSVPPLLGRAIAKVIKNYLVN